MEGLQQSLQYQVVVCDCQTFSELVNKALMLEDKHRAMDDTRKRKLIGSGGPGNARPRPWQSAPARPNFHQQHYKYPVFRQNYQPQQQVKPVDKPPNNGVVKTNVGTPILSHRNPACNTSHPFAVSRTVNSTAAALP